MSEPIKIHGRDEGDFPRRKVVWSALTALRPAKASAPTAVDLSGLTLVRPYTVAAVAALGCLGRRQASLTLPSTHDARDYVVRSGLCEFFVVPDAVELQPSPRAVRVRQLSSVSTTFADEITTAWEREFDDMPVNLRRRLADHLDEIVRNALSHAASPVGCIVAAQVFPGARLVEIAILDTGVTILGHLTRNPLHSSIRSDDEAIVQATKEGITGTRAGEVNSLGEPNSGIGLFELREYCESGGGTVTIVSGGAIVTFGLENETGPDVLPFEGDFPGCLINIRFNV